ncbi:MAG: flavoprotein [Candidatus Omnitrophota bacterium]
MSKKKEIIIAVTGGISAYKSCEIVRKLVKDGFGVTVLMSKEALEFIGPLTFRTLSSRPVVTDMFDRDIAWDKAHISLAELADLIVVVPATANIIAKLAHGLCDDIISCVIMASKAKIMVAPAMNENMYKHPVFQENLKKIKALNYKIINPIIGDLACGKKGIGHLAEVQTIISEIKKAVS